MKTQDLIAAALVSASTDEVTIYWDSAAGADAGPAYRRSDGEHDSGPLDFQGWLRDGERVKGGEVEGYYLTAYFRGPDGAYTGPDQDGIYPDLVA